MLDDLDRAPEEFDLLNNPRFFRTGADPTTAVRTAAQSVFAHVVDIVGREWWTLMFCMTRLASDLAFLLPGIA